MAIRKLDIQSELIMQDTKMKPESQKSEIIKNDFEAYNLRKGFSADDLQDLISSMDNVISEYKADQKGFDPENMVKTVRGGKTVWITKDEMNTMLSKRRRFFEKDANEKVQEGVQESSESYRRLTICQNYIDAIRMVSAESSIQFVKFKRSLEASMNQSSSKAKEFRMMEQALLRKKNEDPLYREMQQANEKMMKALEENNVEEAEICQTYTNRHNEEYLALQNRIDAYTKKVDECKEVYVLSKKKMYLLQFEFIKRSSKSFVDPIKELMYHDEEKALSNQSLELLKKLQSKLKDTVPDMKQLQDLPIEEMKSNPEQFSKVDQYLVDLFDDLMILIESFNHAWTQCVTSETKLKSPAQQIHKPIEKKVNRMAYPESHSERKNK